MLALFETSRPMTFGIQKKKKPFLDYMYCSSRLLANSLFLSHPNTSKGRIYQPAN